MRSFFFAAVVAILATPAFAQDRDACPAGQVCASAPATVFAALEKAKLKPKLGKDGNGDPLIEVEGAPYHFDVYFYGCEKAKNCDSLRFEVIFEKDADATPLLANKWNSSHRFIQAAVKDDGRFVMAYDVPTIGGINARNFADVLDWWTSMLGEAGDFFGKELGEKKQP
ncbi:YbjN domain-containing protein [Sphingomonas soli]|uniref:YbjN domain-containing protein n=1 Tax=Sphingomonas soli TaxID=266127 RepID=UPI0008321C7D|nr:YbjN domain-containing protein [Sphingomonas soli]